MLLLRQLEVMLCLLLVGASVLCMANDCAESSYKCMIVIT